MALVFLGAPLRKFDQPPKIPGGENLPVHKISQIRGLFFEMDVNGDGLLSPQELQRLLKEAGIAVTLDQAMSFVDDVDRDGDRNVNLLEFLELMGHNVELALYWEAFRGLDEDKSGSLSPKEMRRGMRTMDIPHPHREAEKMFRRLKTDEVNFHQFVEWMVRLDAQDADQQQQQQ